MGVEHYEIYPAPKPFRVPRKLKIIVVVMLLCAMGGLAGLASAAGKTKQPAPGTPTYLGYAQLVAQNYVSGHPLGLPVASGLTTALGRSTQEAATSQQSQSTGTSTQPSTTVAPLNVAYLSFVSGNDRAASGGTIETDTFVIEQEDGSLSQLVVVLSGQGSKVPTLGAAPTLLPESSASAGGAVQTGVSAASSQNSVPTKVVSQVNAWATAFTTSNHDLYIVTGDTANRSYNGITGYKLVGNPLIVSSTPYDPAKPATSIELTVQLTLQSTSNPAVVTTSTYDLLADNLNDALPSIAAWGPPGSGSSLVPFQNGY